MWAVDSAAERVSGESPGKKQSRHFGRVLLYKQLFESGETGTMSWMTMETGSAVYRKQWQEEPPFRWKFSPEGILEGVLGPKATFEVKIWVWGASPKISTTSFKHGPTRYILWSACVKHVQLQQVHFPEPSQTFPSWFPFYA